MTLKYKNSKIEGLSSDIKPTNAQANRIFFETNTKKTFDFDGTIWVERVDSFKATVASPTFTGTVTTAALDVANNNIDNIKNLIHDISTTTTTLDFSVDQLQTISISAATTFTSSNLAIGKSKTIKITTDATLRTLTFPAWRFVGKKPTDQAASKISILTITSFGTTDADCVAAFAVEA